MKKTHNDVPNAMNNRDLGHRVGLGALVLIAAAVPITGTFYPGRFADLEAFRHWQESAGAILGLIAAAFAANYVVMQIRHAQEMEDRRLARARRAWRATMPSALSVVAGYAADSYDALVKQHSVAMSADGLTKATNPAPNEPEFNDHVLGEIRSMIEVATESEADHYIELLSDIQVHRARWEGRLKNLERGQNIIGIELEGEMVKAAELYARASNLLGAARPKPNDKVTSRLWALRLLTPGMEPMPSIAQRAEQYDINWPLTAPETSPPPAQASRSLPGTAAAGR